MTPARVVSLALALACVALAAAQEPFVLRVDVPLVSLDVFVDDPTGKPIIDLKQEDFIALEDGAVREIRNFSSAETPYHVLLLFDRSASTANQWQFLLQAVARFIDQLPEHHQIALAAFDSEPKMLLDWRSPRAATRQGLTIRSDGSGSDVYKALEWSAKQLEKVKGRKGVLVLTDGLDQRLGKELVSFDAQRNPTIAPPSADRQFIRTVEAIMGATAPFYFIAINTDINSGPGVLTTGFEFQSRMQARLRMELAAERSNGHVYYPKSINDIRELYDRIGRELGNSYSIGFTPGAQGPAGGFHKIEIQVRDRHLRVTQSREGFYSR
jgi:VWFA-related protein